MRRGFLAVLIATLALLYSPGFGHDRFPHEISPSSVSDFSVSGTLDIVPVATENDDHALEIDHDSVTFADSKALDIVYDVGELAAGDDDAAIFIDIDEFSATGGDIFAVEVLATEGSATVYGLGVGAVIHPILQASGTFANMDSALVIASNERAAFISTATDVSIFVADNDTVTIGDADQYSEIEFILDTTSSGAGIKPTFEFSIGVGDWTAFSPTDGTNGMRNTGIVAWEVSNIPTWAVGTGNEFLIRITRTRAVLSQEPVEDKVQIAATVIYTWDKDGSLLAKDYSFEGSTDDDNETLLTVTDPTADRTITFPNASGEVSLFGQTLTRVIDFVIEAPLTGDTGRIQAHFPEAATLIEVQCSTSSGTSNINLDERTEAAPDSSVSDLLTSDLLCDTNGQNTTTFDDSAIAADKILALLLITPFTVDWLRVHVEYTVP